MKKRALIVEDDALFARLLRSMLQQNGFEVIGTFDHGEDAIEFLDHNEVTLITMDIDLEGKLNGLETTEKLREKTPTPVLFISAREESTVHEKANSFSPSLFLSKFINKEQFTEAIESLDPQRELLEA